MILNWDLHCPETDAKDEPYLPSHPFERQYLRFSISNAVGRIASGGKRSLSDGLTSWLEQQAPQIGLIDSAVSHSVASLSAKEVAKALASASACAGKKTLAPSPLEKRLHWIETSLGLGKPDAAILKTVVRAALHRPLRDFCDALAETEQVEDELSCICISLLLGRASRSVRVRLQADQPLISLGLIEGRGGGDYAPTNTIMRIARLARSEPEYLRREMFGRHRTAQLGWRDFEHLGPLRDLGAQVIKSALARHERGVVILLYGAPGTGKTEFAKAVAKQSEATAVFIGETDENKNEPSRSDRIAHFALTSKLAAGTGHIVLVVDEADDLFTGVDADNRASRTGSKVFMNRLVEECDVPTIWITNKPDRLGPAVLRRMAIAIRFHPPGREIRRRMVERLATKRRVRLDADGLEKIAALDAPPAILDAGLRTASLAGGGAPIAIAGATSLIEALNGAPTIAVSSSPIAFDPGLSAADCDLTALAARVEASFRAGKTALSFCLHGLPGTGKSAYARW